LQGFDHPSIVAPFSCVRADNQVVLRCGSDKRPISWVRTEGAGRVFYTALGHTEQSFAEPAFLRHLRGALSWLTSG